MLFYRVVCPMNWGWVLGVLIGEGNFSRSKLVRVFSFEDRILLFGRGIFQDQSQMFSIKMTFYWFWLTFSRSPIVFSRSIDIFDFFLGDFLKIMGPFFTMEATTQRSRYFLSLRYHFFLIKIKTLSKTQNKIKKKPQKPRDNPSHSKNTYTPLHSHFHFIPFNPL